MPSSSTHRRGKIHKALVIRSFCFWPPKHTSADGEPLSEAPKGSLGNEFPKQAAPIHVDSGKLIRVVLNRVEGTSWAGRLRGLQSMNCEISQADLEGAMVMQGNVIRLDEICEHTMGEALQLHLVGRMLGRKLNDEFVRRATQFRWSRGFGFASIGA